MDIPEKIFEALAKKIEGNIRENLKKNPDDYWFFEFYTELPEIEEWTEQDNYEQADKRIEAFERELMRRIRKK